VFHNTDDQVEMRETVRKEDTSMQTPAENHPQNRTTLAAPDRILVATDLTDTDCLVSHAVAQARASGAQVTLVHAIAPSDVVAMDGAVIPYVDKAKIFRDVRVMLHGVARQFELQGITCDTAVRDGVPCDVIREEISRINATRLIMGTHGRAKLGQLTLGSVAHDLIAEVPIPVFVVGPHARDSVRHVTPRRILHPVSLIGEYRESLNLALEIAQEYKAELILLHVLDRNVNQSIDPERIVSWAKKALDALIPNATNPVSLVETRVTSGKLAEEILKAAVETDADWIVLGADGGLRSWFFPESAAYKMVAAAPCPVLTLRHEPTQTEVVNLEEVHFTSPL
jgi:nucleotide-binding universal stress UspA family protein